MYRFYVEASQIGQHQITVNGTDVNHIKNVLRLRQGDWILACDGAGTDYITRIQSLDSSAVILNIEKSQPSETELDCDIILFQGLPKKDKMELIIQKTIELGVTEIVPVETKRCVARLDDAKRLERKMARWRAVAEAAAKQSGRGIVPTVAEPVSLREAFDRAQTLAYNMIPYELQEGMENSRKIMAEACSRQSVGIFIGPEGGFEKDEVEAAIARGIRPISLGKRILRTETAGIAVLAIMMFQMQ